MTRNWGYGYYYSIKPFNSHFVIKFREPQRALCETLITLSFELKCVRDNPHLTPLRSLSWNETLKIRVCWLHIVMVYMEYFGKTFLPLDRKNSHWNEKLDKRIKTVTVRNNNCNKSKLCKNLLLKQSTRAARLHLFAKILARRPFFFLPALPINAEFLSKPQMGASSFLHLRFLKNENEINTKSYFELNSY